MVVGSWGEWMRRLPWSLLTKWSRLFSVWLFELSSLRYKLLYRSCRLYDGPRGVSNWHVVRMRTVRDMEKLNLLCKSAPKPALTMCWISCEKSDSLCTDIREMVVEGVRRGGRDWLRAAEKKCTLKLLAIDGSLEVPRSKNHEKFDPSALTFL